MDGEVAIFSVTSSRCSIVSFSFFPFFAFVLIRFSFLLVLAVAHTRAGTVSFLPRRGSFFGFIELFSFSFASCHTSIRLSRVQSLSRLANHVFETLKLSYAKDHCLFLPAACSGYSSRLTYSWYINSPASTISTTAIDTTTNAPRISKPTPVSPNLQPLPFSPILHCSEQWYTYE